MSRLSGSPYVLDYHDLDHPHRPVFQVSTPAGDRYDTAPLERVAPAGEFTWLWPGMIPLRRVTLIEGSSGAGKSQLALDLAARLTKSVPWPNGEPNALPASDVLVVCRRDEASVVSARFARAGGDPKRLSQFCEFHTYLPDSDIRDSRPIAFPFDFPALEYLVETHPFGMVIIDSLAEFCATPKLFAETLVRLEDLAARANIALIVTVPANCQLDSQGRLRVTSRWPTDAARWAWSLVRDPDDPLRRLFVAKRTNFCLEPDGLAFRLGDQGVAWEERSRINPVDPLAQLSASELCLQDLLSAGPLPASTVYRLGAELGFNPKALRAAGKRLKVTSQRIGFSGDGHWSWSLPGLCLEADSSEVGCVEQVRALARHHLPEPDSYCDGVTPAAKATCADSPDRCASMTQIAGIHAATGASSVEAYVDEAHASVRRHSSDTDSYFDSMTPAPDAACADTPRNCATLMHPTPMIGTNASPVSAVCEPVASASTAIEVPTGEGFDRPSCERPHPQARRRKGKKKRIRKKEWKERLAIAEGVA